VRDARVAFFPHWDAPLMRMPARAVVTVHDLIPFRVPGAFPVHKRALARPALARVLRTASRIVCVSEASANDVRQWAPAQARKVVAIPNGVADVFANASPAVLTPGVAVPYLLCVGNQKPHKNLAAAVGVLAHLRGAGHAELRLVVAGRQFTPDGDARRLAHAAGVGDAVVPIGEVGDEALRALYASCGVLLFPSRYEGFGLPVLEAMLAGAPVVASSTPAVAEVAGDAASLHAPDDVAGMAAACHRLLTDEAARADSVRRGRAWAARFRWTETARRTGRLLQAVAGVARS
jgi:glycosyltransferase involved in cell wall biosynthesis